MVGACGTTGPEVAGGGDGLIYGGASHVSETWFNTVTFPGTLRFRNRDPNARFADRYRDLQTGRETQIGMTGLPAGEWELESLYFGSGATRSTIEMRSGTRPVVRVASGDVLYIGHIEWSSDRTALVRRDDFAAFRELVRPPPAERVIYQPLQTTAIREP